MPHFDRKRRSMSRISLGAGAASFLWRHVNRAKRFRTQSMHFPKLICDGKCYPQRLVLSVQMDVNKELDGDFSGLSRGYLVIGAVSLTHRSAQHWSSD